MGFKGEGRGDCLAKEEEGQGASAATTLRGGKGLKGSKTEVNDMYVRATRSAVAAEAPCPSSSLTRQSPLPSPLNLIKTGFWHKKVIFEQDLDRDLS